MILGVSLQPTHLLIGGVLALTLLTVEFLIGLRVIHFKGRLHLRVHKTLAWVLVAVAVAHGLAALVYFQDWQILS